MLMFYKVVWQHMPGVLRFLVIILLENQPVNDCENRLRFDRDITVSVVEHGVLASAVVTRPARLGGVRRSVSGEDRGRRAVASLQRALPQSPGASPGDEHHSSSPSPAPPPPPRAAAAADEAARCHWPRHGDRVRGAGRADRRAAPVVTGPASRRREGRRGG